MRDRTLADEQGRRTSFMTAKITPISGDPKKPSPSDREWARQQMADWADEDKANRKAAFQDGADS